MKKSFLKMNVTLIVFLLFGQLISAQQHPNCPHNKQRTFNDSVCGMISNLSAEQEKKIKEFRISHREKMQDLRADLNIKKAELKKLETADKPDMNKINAKIDEIGAIETSMDKERAKHIQDVRSILTKEQLVDFDAKVTRNGGCMHQGNMDCGMKHGNMQHKQNPNCPAKN